MGRVLVWRGVDEPRMEIARAEVDGAELRAGGTQIGVSYELRYELEPGRLRAEIVGGPSVDLGLDDTDFFDLAASPLFNSLPVLAGLDRSTDFVMSFVHVPSLEVTRSEQRYEPLGDRRVRYRSGSFVADLDFDADGFVVRYEGLAELVG
jgi:hypothetical protein